MSDPWNQAITGLRCIAYVTDRLLGKKPKRGEVTALEDGWVWVVLDGEEEPRRVFWTDIRPSTS